MKALLVHSDLKQCGGAEDYAVSFQKALNDLGWDTWMLDINGMYHDNERTKDSFFLKIFRSVPFFKRLSLFKYAVVCRYMKRQSQDYDLVVYTYGEGPKVDCKVIRVMHAPGLFSLDSELLTYLGVDTTRKVSLFGRRLYTWICRVLANPSMEDSADVITIVNSKWTQSVVSRVWKIQASHILYPRVSLALDDKRAVRKKNIGTFVALGRIVPNKRLEDAISIISNLRKKGYDVTLDIVGRANTPYAEKLAEICKAHPAVTLYPNVSDEHKKKLLEQAQFGLHCYRNEHFGIAVAEMLQLGCIPIVYDGGGVTELVEDGRQRYTTISEAVDNISSLLDLPANALQRLSCTQKDNKTLARAMRFDAEITNLINKVQAQLKA